MLFDRLRPPVTRMFWLRPVVAESTNRPRLPELFGLKIWEKLIVAPFAAERDRLDSVKVAPSNKATLLLVVELMVDVPETKLTAPSVSLE